MINPLESIPWFFQDLDLPFQENSEDLEKDSLEIPPDKKDLDAPLEKEVLDTPPEKEVLDQERSGDLDPEVFIKKEVISLFK